MTPIINPWFFYWGSVANGVIVVSSVFTVISLVVLLALIACHFAEDDSLDKFMKPTIVAVVISVLLLVFTPDAKTLIRMEVARNITVERIEAVQENTEEFIDYVIERIMEIKDVTDK